MGVAALCCQKVAACDQAEAVTCVKRRLPWGVCGNQS